MEHDFEDRGIICRTTEHPTRDKNCWECTNLHGDALKEVNNRNNPGYSDNPGACCTGFMDYGEHPEYWSDCSVRYLRDWAVDGKHCMLDGNITIYFSKNR